MTQTPYTPGPLRAICGKVTNETGSHFVADCGSGDEAYANAALFAVAPDMRDELAGAKIALQHAANTFYRYAQLHRSKETEDGDAKACANASMGEEMNEAIARIDALIAKTNH